MAARARAVEVGVAHGRRLQAELCRDLDAAIHAGGLTYSSVGKAVGLSGDQVGRVSRGEVRNVGLVQLSTLFAATGLRLAARVYPAGDPIRDAAQVALIRRMRDHIGTELRMQLEVPVVRSIPLGSARVADLRAWDALILVADGRIAVEAETRITDVQALLRRLELKRRDGNVDRLVVVVNDTAHNRRVMAAFADLIHLQFPGTARASLRAMRRASIPAADTILLL